MTMLDRETELFQRALDEARRSNCAASADAGAEFESRPSMRAAIEFGPARGGGGQARWSHALNWASEPDERPRSLTPIRGSGCQGSPRGRSGSDRERAWRRRRADGTSIDAPMARLRLAEPPRPSTAECARAGDRSCRDRQHALRSGAEPPDERAIATRSIRISASGRTTTRRWTVLRPSRASRPCRRAKPIRRRGKQLSRYARLAERRRLEPPREWRHRL